MKPIIGLNLDVKAGPPEEVVLQANYYRAIQSAGGIPILLPPTPDSDLETLLKEIHGLVMIGGDDYCPSHYGEKPHVKTDVCHPDRDEFDLRLIKKALGWSNMPVLGICAGAQLLNIVLGGTLIQDIISEQSNAQDHRSKNGWNEGFTRHSVKLQPHTELFNIYKQANISVVSSHHQAIRQLGQGLSAVAWADDGIVEAVESKMRPFTIGVQWHPERDYDGNIELFSEFVKRCSQSS